MCLRFINSRSAPAGVAVLAIILGIPPLAGAEDFPEFSRDPAQARIVADDLERFWTAWDLAEREPGERRAIFQREYLDAGTAGLKGFVEVRIQDVDRLLAAIDRHPRYYASLRALTPDIPAAAEPALEAMRKLHALLPEAVFPDTYLMIGRMNTGGTTHREGLLIGAEMYGMTPDTPTGELGSWHRAVIGTADDLPVIIIHELIHIQQANLTRSGPHASVLGVSIHEGSADFLTDLLVGRHINTHIHEWALPREAGLWSEFREIMHGEETGPWLYGGESSDDRPADLGYFIGYRIAQAYYEQAEDKQAAIRDILAITDPAGFLEASGYEGRLPE